VERWELEGFGALGPAFGQRTNDDDAYLQEH
jgi:hypothetical protein